LVGDRIHGGSNGTVEEFSCVSEAPTDTVFELGPELLDGVELRGVGWKKKNRGSGKADGFDCLGILVGRQVVHDHAVAVA